MRWTRILPVMGGVAGIATLVAVSAVPAAATGSSDGPSGSAFAAKAEVTALNAVKVDVPPLPAAHYPKGADKSVIKAELLPPNGDIVTAKILNAASDLQGGKLGSQASIADVRALHGLLEAQLIEANCSGDGSGVHGDSRLVHVKINGKELTVDAKHPVDVDAAGNAVPGGIIKLRADEQIKDGNTLTVNALHVTVGGQVKDLARADVILSQAKCSLGNGAGIAPPPTSKPNPTSKSGGAPATSSGPGVGNTANQGQLANTGASGIVPMIIGAAVLLGAGTGALFWTRRRRGATSTGSGTES